MKLYRIRIHEKEFDDLNKNKLFTISLHPAYNQPKSRITEFCLNLGDTHLIHKNVHQQKIKHLSAKNGSI